MKYKKDYLYSEFKKSIEKYILNHKTLRIKDIDEIYSVDGYQTKIKNGLNDDIDKKIIKLIKTLDLHKASIDLKDGGLGFDIRFEIELFIIIGSYNIFNDEIIELFVTSNDKIISKGEKNSSVNSEQLDKIENENILSNYRNIICSAYLLGLVKGLLKYTIEYINNRKQFGRKIIENQYVSFEVAKIFAEFQIIEDYLVEIKKDLLEHRSMIDNIFYKVSIFSMESLNRLIHFNGAFGMTALSEARSFVDSILDFHAKFYINPSENNYYKNWRN